ncbi:MAG: TIGR01777 family oxidoreductase [Myxococcota bacterium]
MRILVSGATGLIGGALRSALIDRGDTVVTLTRRPRQAPAPAVGWDLSTGHLEAGALEDVDAVIHLAGEGIAATRWNEAHKRRVLESRTLSTKLLADALAASARPPRVFISASAIGFYGHRGDARLDEGSERGQGFLSDVCVAWEAAAEPARAAGIRVVHPRIGIVMAPDGGALDKMLLPFKMGLGGRVGSGRQYMSWIGLSDVVGLVLHALDREVEGPLNVTAPEPVTNADFTHALGTALNRPTLVPLPAFAAKVALGSEMAEALLLSSTRAVPQKALDTGFTFQEPDLPTLLRSML